MHSNTAALIKRKKDQGNLCLCCRAGNAKPPVEIGPQARMTDKGKKK